jgi:S-methylmethionine-dependent homocysteine/selenocysteine methylase
LIFWTAEWYVVQHTPASIAFDLIGYQGTTLEDVLGVNISDSPLWSAKYIKEDPEVIIKAHLAFLEAGASIIQTATLVILVPCC